jgi:hypothetical protein
LLVDSQARKASTDNSCGTPKIERIKDLKSGCSERSDAVGRSSLRLSKDAKTLFHLGVHSTYNVLDGETGNMPKNLARNGVGFMHDALDGQVTSLERLFKCSCGNLGPTNKTIPIAEKIAARDFTMTTLTPLCQSCRKDDQDD